MARTLAPVAGAGVLLLALVAACSKANDAPAPQPSGTASALAVAPVVASPAPPAASSAPTVASPLVPTKTAKCCRMDRREGVVGNEHAVHTSYASDVVLTKSDKRIFGSDDVVSDTTELFQHARSMNRSLRQERTLAFVGEGPRWLSLTVDDRGDTGTGTPFRHSACKTIDPNNGHVLKLDDVLVPAAVDRVIAEAKDVLAHQPEGRHFRVVPGSFALPDEGHVVMCAPSEETDGDARRDVSVAIRDDERKPAK